MSFEFESDINSNFKSSADNVPNILEDLKNIFVCNSCKTNILPPIRTCKKGHNICEKCNMYSTCTVCDIAIQKVLRNVELENGRAKVISTIHAHGLKIHSSHTVSIQVGGPYGLIKHSYRLYRPVLQNINN